MIKQETTGEETKALCLFFVDKGGKIAYISKFSDEVTEVALTRFRDKYFNRRYV
jgi:hypothetical protein